MMLVKIYMWCTSFYFYEQSIVSKHNLVLNFGFKNETMSYNKPHKVKSESFAIWLWRHYWLRK